MGEKHKDRSDSTHIEDQSDAKEPSTGTTASPVNDLQSSSQPDEEADPLVDQLDSGSSNIAAAVEDKAAPDNTPGSKADSGIILVADKASESPLVPPADEPTPAKAEPTAEPKEPR